MDAIEQTKFFDRTIAIRPSDPMFISTWIISGFAGECVVTKNHADIILKTGYFSVAVMVFLFISMFLLTTLHP